MSIQRYNPKIIESMGSRIAFLAPSPDGEYVNYWHHLAAVAAARKEALEEAADKCESEARRWSANGDADGFVALVEFAEDIRALAGKEGAVASEPFGGSEQLKPCPFCGATPVVTHDCGTEIGCPTTNCCVAVVESSRGKFDEAVRIWNRRTPSPAVRALVEACRNCWLDDEKRPERAIKDALAAVEREIGGE